MIKVLVADDSALMRRVLGEIFREEGDFEVAFARDGVEALAQVHAFGPDVVTLDVQMPRLDGLACLDRIMVEHPCPVVMVSALTREGAETTLEALDLGAVDFAAKPRGVASLAVDELAPILLEKVRAAATAKVRRAHRLVERVRQRAQQPGPAAARAVARASVAGALPGLVLVGVSTGGPPALEELLGRLPPDFEWPILIAQHMPAAFTATLARRLNGLCALSVQEVTRPTVLVPGGVYLARGDADMLVSRRAGGLVALPTPASDAHRWHPSVDRLVVSAMEHVAAEALIAVQLTGMGDDGAKAMAALRAAGGRTLAEAEETAVVWGMPGALVRLGGADQVAPLHEVSGLLAAWTKAR